MYYYKENFYHDLEQLIDDLDFENVEELPTPLISTITPSKLNLSIYTKTN